MSTKAVIDEIKAGYRRFGYPKYVRISGILDGKYYEHTDTYTRVISWISMHDKLINELELSGNLNVEWIK